jgi:hypothetical protein
VDAKVAHAHPACGNGVAWWLEHRRAGKAAVLSEGAIELGGSAKVPGQKLNIKKGDLLVLAVDAKNGDHTCDLTEIALTISASDKPKRTWDLADDVADTIHAGNPHDDKLGNKKVWSFVKGPTRPVGKAAQVIPSNSVLGRWRKAAANPDEGRAALKLAMQVQTLLTGARPPKKDPNQVLYDNLVSADSFLFQNLDPVRLAKPRPTSNKYGLPKERFGKNSHSLVVGLNSITEVRLPAVLFRDRYFVVEGKVDASPGDRVVQFLVSTAPSNAITTWDGINPVVGSQTGANFKRLLQGYDDFRRSFPSFISFNQVVPTDEVVCLKMYHREDEPLARLFLDDKQKRGLDRLWDEHRFISQQPVAENKYLPQFIGFVTQDQPKELLAYFESQRGPFRKRAEAFEKDMEAAIPRQISALLDFAARAYRRPLNTKEEDSLRKLYQTMRKKGASHDEAFYGVLVRVLVSPAFLFRIEKPPAGKTPGPVNDWELATRLSYFLWSSGPDNELRKLAAAGRLGKSEILAQQAKRMIKDSRVRALAIEFGTQWIHVRGFDELKEKNEKLFPTFSADLRKAIYEESILFFQDLFQSDRSLKDILDADYTFLNEALAKHYGIPGVAGSQWRQVNGVKKYGRGGILGLASVQAKQSGASRTSPVLRGNWVVETLLGEKLPRPPKDVPRLPEEESGSNGLSTRQMVEKHASVASCAVCHRRIDPFGFALERYDPIGRRRDKDFGGRAIDTQAKLKDGTKFEDIDGLRTYLLSKKKDVIVRLFCRKLLGYALGRAVTLSDQELIETMVKELNKNEGRLSSAVLTIIQSKQFRTIRGSGFASNE